MVDLSELIKLSQAQVARDEIVRAGASDSRMATAMLAAIALQGVYVPYEGATPPADWPQQRAKLAVDYAEFILAEVQRRRVPPT